MNVGIMGDRLSYEELFKKNKKRGRSDRNSMANYSSGMSDITLIDGNQTMTKSLRKSMFNEPMSVRGIKRIVIEEDEKNVRMHEVPIDEESHEDVDTNLVNPAEPNVTHVGLPPLGGKAKHKLTLTNIVEEEISPTSKSSASILGKPHSTKVALANAIEPNTKFSDTQRNSTADDKELLEEQSLHSGSVE